MKPENLIKEITFQFSTSQGNGGQNVNKRETKAQGFFDIENSQLLNTRQKLKLRTKYRQYVNQDGKIMLISNQESRTQKANKEAVIKRFLEIINDVLTPDKARIETKIPKSQIIKRQTDKKSQSKIKTQRQGKIEIE
ncbi:MAG: peptide chain release factor-like protein [Candidatus Absconditabacteria bacterium]